MLTKVKGSVWDSADNGLAVNVKDFGAHSITEAGYESFDSTSAIQAAFDSVGSTPSVFIFPAGTYLISSTVNFTAPANSTVFAYSALFTCTHNGVAFDLNPDATAQIPLTSTVDTYTKRNISWFGGIFINTNATKTASVAIQAYYMRVFRVRDVRIGNAGASQGFYTGIRFGAKDTYFFDQCYIYDCIRAYEVPDEGVLHTAALTGNDLLLVEITGQIAGSPACEWGFYCGARVIGLEFKASINGAFTGGHVKFVDGSVTSGRGYTIGFHSEQVASSTPALVFESSRGAGFTGVTITGAMEVSSADTGWQGIEFQRCLGVKINACVFQDGSGGATERAIYIDNNCRDITIDTESCFFGNIPDANQIVLESNSVRRYVYLLPETVWLEGPLNMTGYNGVGAIATAAGLLDVDSLISIPSDKTPKLPVRSWIVTAQFSNNTGGATPALNACRLRLVPANNAGTAALSSNSGITLWTGGLPNQFISVQQGTIKANPDGNLWLDILTTHDNATVVLNVQGYTQ